MKKPTQNLLVMTILGNDRTGLVSELSKIIADSGCSLKDSRMLVLGREFTAFLTVAGKWNELAKLESCLPTFSRRLNLSIHSRRTEAPEQPGNLLPYAIEIATLEQPDVIHQLAAFLADHNISIREITTSSYTAEHTGTPMLTIQMTVDIPTRLHIAQLRDDFMDFCDSLNLDALMEPFKG